MVALGLGKPGKLENVRENNFFLPGTPQGKIQHQWAA